MPRSKRDKKVYLTKTTKKGLSLKQRIVEDVRNCVEKFDSLYVFKYRDIRNSHLKGVRNEWENSKLHFGKNKVVAVSLGRTEKDEIEDNIHKITRFIKGPCGLLFTNCKREEVVDWFENFSVADFARSGFKVDKTITLSEGPLSQFSHSMEPYLRKLGLPTKLERGIVTLIKDYVVCKEGDALTPEQAKLLELLGHKMATFRFKLRAVWSKPGNFERLSKKDDQDDVDIEDEEMEEGNE
ncbi:hypothetical protein NQ315_004235 [Exocentrus adspersus]|uniref:Ribosome assembly factor mrt4 n=1 Tax=Exocentrus adspersus TaxID=1586481 RepID=A0AAV8W8D7_9CUCU|nr:hypothetical protein NQ315_004235 [Exocentrus adspersus]